MKLITAYGASRGGEKSLSAIAVLQQEDGRYKVPMWAVGSPLPAHVEEVSPMAYETEEQALSVFDSLVQLLRAARAEAGLTA